MFFHTIHHHGRRIHHTLLRRLNLSLAFFVTFFAFVVVTLTGFTFASSTANFTMVINPGSLAVRIIDNLFHPVSNPSVTFDNKFYSKNCQNALTFFGTTQEQIYIENPQAADHGWSVTLAALNPTSVWSSGTDMMDFNDPTANACEDGNDSDAVGGQMTIYPSVATLTTGQCSHCTINNLSLGSSSSFSEGIVDSITLLSASPSSEFTGDWILKNIPLSQTIPAGQHSGQYTIVFSLSITAQ